MKLKEELRIILTMILSNQEEYLINGIENRIEQIIANLLDNSISFSDDNKKILVEISKKIKKKLSLKVIDEGKGFKETSTKKYLIDFIVIDQILLVNILV